MQTFTRFLEGLAAGHLVEMDLATAYANTVVRRPDILDRLRGVRISGVSAMPNPDRRTLLFLAQVVGTSDGYETFIQFSDVEFKPLPKDGQLTLGNYLLTAAHGKKYYFGLLGYRGSHFKARCSCPDFVRLADTHRRHRTYLESTGDVIPLPEAQGYDSPMLCKHLVKLAQYLKEKGVLVAKAALGFEGEGGPYTYNI